MEAEQTQTVDTEQPAALSFDQSVAALDALAAGETPNQPEMAESQADTPAPNEGEADEAPAEIPAKLNAKQVAEMLQIDPADLYNRLEVLPDMTLGQLKDRAKDLQGLDVLQAEMQSNRATVEADLMQKNQVLQRRMQRANIQLTEQDVSEYQADVEQYRQLQNRTITELVPEYAESAFQQKFDGMVGQRLSDLGVPDHEQQMVTSGWLRLELYQHQRLLQEIGSVGGKKVKQNRKQGPRSRTSNGNAVTQVNAAVKSGNMSQDSAVTELGKLL
jgi:hypothetical protein